MTVERPLCIPKPAELPGPLIHPKLRTGLRATRMPRRCRETWKLKFSCMQAPRVAAMETCSIIPVRYRLALNRAPHQSYVKPLAPARKHPSPCRWRIMIASDQFASRNFMQDLKILQKTAALHEARWWNPEPGGKAHCYLCPRHCHIGDGQAGFCFIRVNEGGKLYSLGYASPAAIQIDPIEKKPLNHFLPGTRVFSMGTAGCNMGCFFCQNWDISKSRQDQVRSQPVAPEDAPLLAGQYGCDSIAFTYNEPTIWGEYVIDICKSAREHGLKTVMVSNGYITREAFHDIYDHADAANIDLKAFTETFYGKITLTHLEPVLETLQWLKRETNVWFEITNLMIPDLNDDPAE